LGGKVGQRFGQSLGAVMTANDDGHAAVHVIFLAVEGLACFGTVIEIRNFMPGISSISRSNDAK
jgi:hypothetical protein